MLIRTVLPSRLQVSDHTMMESPAAISVQQFLNLHSDSVILLVLSRAMRMRQTSCYRMTSSMICFDLSHSTGILLQLLTKERSWFRKLSPCKTLTVTIKSCGLHRTPGVSERGVYRSLMILYQSLRLLSLSHLRLQFPNVIWHFPFMMIRQCE